MTLAELAGLTLPRPAEEAADWDAVLRLLVRDAVRAGVVPGARTWAGWSRAERQLWLEERQRHADLSHAAAGLGGTELGRAQLLARHDGGTALLDLTLEARARQVLGTALARGAGPQDRSVPLADVPHGRLA